MWLEMRAYAIDEVESFAGLGAGNCSAHTLFVVDHQRALEEREAAFAWSNEERFSTRFSRHIVLLSDHRLLRGKHGDSLESNLDGVWGCCPWH